MKGEQQTCERQLSRSVMPRCPVIYPRQRGKRRTSGYEIPSWKDEVRKSRNHYFPPRVKLYKRCPVLNASFVKAVFVVESNININVKEQTCCRQPFRILQLFSWLKITASSNAFTLRYFNISLFNFSVISFFLCNYDIAVSFTAISDRTLFYMSNKASSIWFSVAFIHSFIRHSSVYIAHPQ